MGHYEPPKQRQAPQAKPRRNLGKLFSTVAFLSVSGIGLIRGIPYDHAAARPDLEAIVETTATPDAAPAGTEITVYAPMIAATETAQGTQPYADGTYVQLSTIRSDRVSEVLKSLKGTDLKVVAEDIPGDRTRLIVKYAEGEQHSIVEKFKALYPDSNPMILKKEQGADKFVKYDAPAKTVQIAYPLAGARNFTHVDIDRMIQAAAREYDVNPDKVRALVHQENRVWDKQGADLTKALFEIGDKGKSYGIMQIHTPAHPDYDVQRGMKDPLYNIRFGVAYFKSVGEDYSRYNGTGVKAQLYERSARRFEQKKPWMKVLRGK